MNDDAGFEDADPDCVAAADANGVGQSSDLGAFGVADRIYRESRTRDRPDFDDETPGSITGNDVHFSATDPHIARQDEQALIGEKPGCNRLTELGEARAVG